MLLPNENPSKGAEAVIRKNLSILFCPYSCGYKI